MARHSLASLSDKALLSRLHGLVKQEKQTTLSILLHLAEVDRRDLYLGYGFSSLFDYCVGALGYSRSAAGRRIASARCLHRFPEVYDLLESDQVNLSTVGLVAPILDDDNKDLLLLEIRNKSQQQVETIVARFKPPIPYRDRVRPVRVFVPELGQNTENRRNPLILNSRSGSGNRSNCGIVEAPANGKPGSYDRDGRKRTGDPLARESDQGDNHGKSGGAGRTERRLLIQFLADKEFMAKLEKIKSLLSNKMPAATFEDLFEIAMDEFIDRHSPEKREERRKKRRAKESEKQTAKLDAKNNHKQNVQEKNRGGGRTNVTSKSSLHETDASKRSRCIPARTRDAVYRRDGGKCAYMSKNGKRCGSTHNLQIDHIRPFARGGKNTPSNLRLLCGRHNRHEAKRILGSVVMNRFTRRE